LGAAKGITLGAGALGTTGDFGANEGSGEAAGGLGKEDGSGTDPGGLGNGLGSAGTAGCLVKVEAPGSGSDGMGMETGGGGGGGAGIGVSASGSTDAAGVTALVALIGRILPNILVTSSGTAVTRCPDRRPSRAGSIDDRMGGSGKLTMA
jgi:hypothetical protein